jgi:predicted membrane metal-binding protein
MLTVFAVSRLSSRRFGVITGLLFALTFVLVLSPLAATGSGFWLSFVAVSVLVLFTAPPQRAPFEESVNDTQLLSRFSAREAIRVSSNCCHAGTHSPSAHLWREGFSACANN